MQNDCLKTQIFYIEEFNIFHTIDYCARPTSKRWVVVKRLATGQNVLEQFRGQPFFGVVRFLNDYFAQPTARAQGRERIEASAKERARIEAEAEARSQPTPKQKKPRKERNPFPRTLAC